jgi:hypothetical protein
MIGNPLPERIDIPDAKVSVEAWDALVTRRVISAIDETSQVFGVKDDLVRAYRWAGYVAALFASHADHEGLVAEFEWPDAWPEATEDVHAQVQEAIEILYAAEGFLREVDGGGYQLTVPLELAVG